MVTSCGENGNTLADHTCVASNLTKETPEIRRRASCASASSLTAQLAGLRSPPVQRRRFTALASVHSSPASLALSLLSDIDGAGEAPAVSEPASSSSKDRGCARPVEPRAAGRAAPALARAGAPVPTAAIRLLRSPFVCQHAVGEALLRAERLPAAAVVAGLRAGAATVPTAAAAIVPRSSRKPTPRSPAPSSAPPTRGQQFAPARGAPRGSATHAVTLDMPPKNIRQAAVVVALLIMLRMLVAAPRVDCVIGSFDAWSPCSRSCETGFQTRTRRIEVPARNGGRPCPRELLAKRVCHTQKCPVHCNFALAWGACDASCGGGSQQSTVVVHAKEAHGGTPCPATPRPRPCATVVCPTPALTYMQWLIENFL